MVSEFIQDRNEAFSSMDETKIRAYCKKYKIKLPDDEEIFWAGVHKAICNLFVIPDSPISQEQYNKSYDWLKEHSYSPSVMGGGEENAVKKTR